MKCPNCGKQIANDSSFCEWCGTRILDEIVSPVTILGYAETFAWNPSVSIYQNGVQIGTVAQNGRIELRITQQCELQFKCSMRSAKCIASLYSNCTSHLYSIYINLPDIHLFYGSIPQWILKTVF